MGFLPKVPARFSASEPEPEAQRGGPSGRKTCCFRVPRVPGQPADPVRQPVSSCPGWRCGPGPNLAGHGEPGTGPPRKSEGLFQAPTPSCLPRSATPSATGDAAVGTWPGTVLSAARPDWWPHAWPSPGLRAFRTSPRPRRVTPPRPAHRGERGWSTPGISDFKASTAVSAPPSVFGMSSGHMRCL